MKALSKLVVLLFLCCQPGFCQQIYYEGSIDLSSTPIDTSLTWYGVYRKTNVNPRFLEQRLYLKPVHLSIQKDSFSFTISTGDTLKSDYLIGFKKAIQPDSFIYFHFLFDYNPIDRLFNVGRQYSFGMGENGQLKVYVNGTLTQKGDSSSIDNYEIMVSHQCYATPYMQMRGWQYNISFDVYQSCIKENINKLLGIKKGRLTITDLPYFIGTIDLNSDQLMDLIFIQNHEYYILLSDSNSKRKKHFSEVKKMKFEFGFF